MTLIENNKEQKTILIAEDDTSMRELISRILQQEGYQTIETHDGLSAMAKVDQKFNLIISDINMPKADGLEVLRFYKEKKPEIPIIMITAFGSISGAVDAMKLGAFDYLSKPLPSPQSLRDTVNRALESQQIKPSQTIIAYDEKMKSLLEQADKVAPRDTTVLILGESGSGKEVIAQYLHQKSPRNSYPFVAVNCAALSENLLESELFGHEKGAFSGAHAQHIGRFEQAHEGTLFLDEVGEMSAALQAKLLRALQERKFERVGGEVTIEVDVRVIAATNRDLKQEVDRGNFRQDLYYRLSVFPLYLAPLRERPDDIIPLAEFFLGLLSQAPGRLTPKLSDKAQRMLQNHFWPGNVRELQNTMERAWVLCGQSKEISENDLGLDPSAALLNHTQDETLDIGDHTLKDLERKAIIAALSAEDGNRKRAAKRLGIALRTLQYKIKDYGI